MSKPFIDGTHTDKVERFVARWYAMFDNDSPLILRSRGVTPDKIDRIKSGYSVNSLYHAILDKELHLLRQDYEHLNLTVPLIASDAIIRNPEREAVRAGHLFHKLDHSTNFLRSITSHWSCLFTEPQFDSPLSRIIEGQHVNVARWDQSAPSSAFEIFLICLQTRYVPGWGKSLGLSFLSEEEKTLLLNSTDDLSPGISSKNE